MELATARRGFHFPSEFVGFDFDSGLVNMFSSTLLHTNSDFQIGGSVEDRRLGPESKTEECSQPNPMIEKIKDQDHVRVSDRYFQNQLMQNASG